MRCNPSLLFAIQVAYASVGVVVGIIVCIAFLDKTFGNTHAAAWGGVSGGLAFLNLTLYVYVFVTREKRGRPLNSNLLMTFAFEGAVATGAGLGGFVAYLGLGIDDSVHHHGKVARARVLCSSNPCSLLLIEPSLVKSWYVASVWSFMTLKWGLSTFFFATRKLRQAPLDGSYIAITN